MNEILVVVDSSKTSSHIINFAVDVAKKMNSYITLAWVSDNANKELDSVKLNIQDKFDKKVNEFSDVLDSSYFELRIISQNPSIELSKLVNDLEIDMVLIEKYDTKNTFKKMFNDYPLQVQAQVECPIIIFPTDYIYNKVLKNIVLPIDSNKNTQQKIPLATIFSKKYDAKVSALFFIDDRNKLASIDQKKQCIDYMDRYKVSEFDSTDLNINLNTDTIIKIVNKNLNQSIVIIMKDNASDSIFKKYTFTQKLINESNIPVMSVPAYKSRSVKSKRYFKL